MAQAHEWGFTEKYKMKTCAQARENIAHKLFLFGLLLEKWQIKLVKLLVQADSCVSNPSNNNWHADWLHRYHLPCPLHVKGS
jgi:hypothetical protein